MNFKIKKWALGIGAYFAFGKPPSNWHDKDQVKKWLIANQAMLVWLLQLTGTNISANFSALLSQVVNNEVLFDVFFDLLSKVWSNPKELIDEQSTFGTVTINTDSNKVIDRIKERIRQRRAKRDTPVKDGGVKSMCRHNRKTRMLVSVMQETE